MPSLRNPVGPLPASIYWRRRIVVLAALSGVLALVVWLAGGQGGNGGSRQVSQDRASSPAPAQSIDAGATPTGPAINSRPGGTGGTGSGPGGDVSVSAGAPSGASPTADGSGGTGAPGVATGGPALNTTAVLALPICTAAQLALELAGGQNAYQAKDKPRLALTVRNTSGGNCRVDLGRTASSIVVTSAANERIWSSGDCPADKQSSWAELAAGSGLTETFTWDRSRSKPNCASADATAVPAGNYLVQAVLSGPSGGPVSARTSIRLDG